MGKFTEALHPRGHGGKFAKGGSGKSGASKAVAKTGDGDFRGYNRKERNQRAKTVRKNVRALGGNRATAAAYARTSKARDKGKLVSAGGQTFHVVGRKNKKSVAATLRKNELSKRATTKKPTAQKKSGKK